MDRFPIIGNTGVKVWVKEDDIRPHLFDPIFGGNRLITQEDINRLQTIEQEYGKLLSSIENQIDYNELYSDYTPSDEEIMERNKRLKWGAFK